MDQFNEMFYMLQTCRCRVLSTTCSHARNNIHYSVRRMRTPRQRAHYIYIEYIIASASEREDARSPQSLAQLQ
jgi:hypothetical protein